MCQIQQFNWVQKVLLYKRTVIGFNNSVGRNEHWVHLREDSIETTLDHQPKGKLLIVIVSNIANKVYMTYYWNEFHVVESEVVLEDKVVHVRCTRSYLLSAFFFHPTQSVHQHQRLLLGFTSGPKKNNAGAKARRTPCFAVGMTTRLWLGSAVVPRLETRCA